MQRNSVKKQKKGNGNRQEGILKMNRKSNFISHL